MPLLIYYYYCDVCAAFERRANALSTIKGPAKCWVAELVFPIICRINDPNYHDYRFVTEEDEVDWREYHKKKTVSVPEYV